MRTREEIEKEAESARERDDFTSWGQSHNTDEQILEVLLDIRDLLSAKEK